MLNGWPVDRKEYRVHIPNSVIRRIMQAPLEQLVEEAQVVVCLGAVRALRCYQVCKSKGLQEQAPGLATC
jgi:hypothetical protein